MTQKVFYDLTRDENAECADKEDLCADQPHPLSCWLAAPCRGICPYLNGSKYGNKT